MLAVVCLMLAVAFIGTNLISYHVTRDALKERVVETELPLTGDTIYSEIQADLVQPIFVSSLMANDTFLRDWILEGEKDAEQIRRYLDTIRQRFGFFTSFLVSAKSRNYYHFTGIAKTVSEDDRRDAWFFSARDLRGEYEVKIDPNQQQNDATTVFINYQIRGYDGEFLGVTGVGMDLATMAGIIDRYRGDYRRTVYFTDRSGRITLHPAADIAYKAAVSDIPGMEKIADTVLSAKEGSFEYSSNGETVLVKTRFIPELDWILFVERRESEATAAASGGLLSNIAIGLAAIFLTGGAIAMAISRFQSQLEMMATTDPLTGLHNRQVFDIELNGAFERARRQGTPLSLVIVDLDRFKSVNDKYGHLRGDEVLKNAASVLRAAVRKSDILARWGGEEFAILMENCDGEKAAESADGLRRKIAEEVTVPGAPDHRISASFGVASMSAKEAGEMLLNRADAALYQAKADGRDRVVRVDAEA